MNLSSPLLLGTNHEDWAVATAVLKTQEEGTASTEAIRAGRVVESESRSSLGIKTKTLVMGCTEWAWLEWWATMFNCKTSGLQLVKDQQQALIPEPHQAREDLAEGIAAVFKTIRFY